MPENAQILSCSTVNVHRYDLVEPWASSQGCINSEIWAYVIIVRSSAYDLTYKQELEDGKRKQSHEYFIDNIILRVETSSSEDVTSYTERISGVYDVFGAAH